MSILITWLGHACFKVESAGYSIVLDPYADDYIPGLSPLRVTANKVLCSHQHDDHCYEAAVQLVGSDVPCPFSIHAVSCAHDDAGGAKRGMNLIHVLESGGLRVAHFGDIGCPLGNDQLAEIGKVDAAMIPVGGYYTIGAKEAKLLADQLGARVVIPIHYRSATFGFPNIGELSEFTRLCDDVVQHDGNSIRIDEHTKKQTAVLKYIP
ncbi:MAG: MBL fold metallo-hydrolase [Christensenellales bacterium]|jgi:L-ascorbate metabolism protein UlaG (beta-lactamase superfamily)